VLTLAGEIVAGVAHGASHVLGVFFGTGVGAAYLHDGRPFRGAGWALEIGSMPFRGDNRRVAGLRTDCLEAYASGRALQEIANRHAVQISSLFEAGATHPALATELEEFVRYQAYAVAAATAMLSPQTIVLGGGVLDMLDYPKERLAELIECYAPIAETRRSMDLRWSELGWLSVLHGASAVVAQSRSEAIARTSDKCEADGRP
jgi:allose kinase